MQNGHADADDLLRRAQDGEERAFTKLLGDHAAALRRAVRRMIGHPDDTDDVVQESALDAWQSLADADSAAPFAHWLAAIGLRQAVAFLRGRERWRADAQVVYQNLCADDAELAGELIETLADPDFRFSVDEHIAYCFSSVARSLAPEDQAALMACDVLELGDRLAAASLGVGEDELRRRADAARLAIEQALEPLCSLTNAKGRCYQCKALRNAAPAARQGPELPAPASIDERIEIVRVADVDAGASQILHDYSWRRLDQLEELAQARDARTDDA